MAGSSEAVKIFILLVFLIIEGCPVAAIRDVRVVLPPVVQAGGAATLLCLFDMEAAPLYAVKWYRGTREIYRYVPGNRPPGQVVPFPGIHVNLSASNEREVTLQSVPPYLSGSFSCEVSADAPSFSTAMAHGELTVTDFPDIKIDSDMFDGGQTLTVNCTYEPLKLPTSLTFYVNNEPAPRSQVREWAGGASLRLAPSARDVSPHGELRLRCILLVDERFPVSSDSVAMWLPVRAPPPPPPTPPPPPHAPWGSPEFYEERAPPPDASSRAVRLKNEQWRTDQILSMLALQLMFLLHHRNSK